MNKITHIFNDIIYKILKNIEFNEEEYNLLEDLKQAAKLYENIKNQLFKSPILKTEDLIILKEIDKYRKSLNVKLNNGYNIYSTLVELRNFLIYNEINEINIKDINGLEEDFIEDLSIRRKRSSSFYISSKKNDLFPNLDIKNTLEKQLIISQFINSFITLKDIKFTVFCKGPKYRTLKYFTDTIKEPKFLSSDNLIYITSKTITEENSQTTIKESSFDNSIESTPLNKQTEDKIKLLTKNNEKQDNYVQNTKSSFVTKLLCCVCNKTAKSK